MRDRDKIEKEKGKQYADKRRHAQESNIGIGKTVWLKRLIPANKLAPNFEPVDHKVISRSGSELVVENILTGTQYRRNITHVKRAPTQKDEEEEEKEPPTIDLERQRQRMRREPYRSAKQQQQVKRNIDRLENERPRIVMGIMSNIIIKLISICCG